MKMDVDKQGSLAYAVVCSKIEWFVEHRGKPEAKALLAQLRRTIGKSPVQNPEIWETVLMGVNPDGGGAGTISPAENAVLLVLGLYAIACQGQDYKTHPIQQKGVSLGKAVGILVGKDSKKRDAMLIRMKKLIASKNFFQVGVNLRALIPMICKEGGLDFPLLAKDLVKLDSAKTKNEVSISWARAFVMASRSSEASNKKGEENE